MTNGLLSGKAPSSRELPAGSGAVFAKGLPMEGAQMVLAILLPRPRTGSGRCSIIRAYVPSMTAIWIYENSHI